MLQSSLKAPSQIDHELFPLLTVRSCVSEADESKNGPRFCAEDKLSGAAYEVRSRKLELEPASPKNSEAAEESAPEQQQRISAVNLQRIRRQQARMDALLSATASGAAPPSVSLPIDIYIQEQPSTGDTYVASVSAFAGLSLGDIIRSGWGVMEEQVFLEILNAVESYGYASASLPPHGNLSCDAIKQLLIVRDGASEERQPSRWVVGDWLLLGDDAACAYDAEAFTADLEWMLQSSFAQLRISTSPAGAYLSPGQVEDVVNETVERIRTVLTRQAAETAATAHEGGAAAAAGAPREGVEGSGDAVEGAGGVPAEQRVTATNSGKTDDAGALPEATGDVSTEPPAPAAQEHVDPAASSLSNDELLMGRGPRNGTRQSGESPRELPPPEHAAATDGTRNMTLKDKMAYHQAALRNEQMLVNKQRRKNAPLPPRPTPTAAASGPTASSGRRSTVTPSFLAADGGGGYRGVPPLTMPIDVKPSAYLTQGQKPAVQSSTKGGTGAARRQPSPHSSRAHAADAHTPRENSRSSAAGAAAAAASAGQPSAATPKAAVVSPRDLQRERLLDDVVNMAVMKQHRRGQHYRIQQEVDRRRREQRQQVLAQNLSPRTLVPMHPYQQQQQHTMPAVLERPRVVRSSSAGSGAVGGTARQGKVQQQQQAGASRRGSAPTAASTATLAPPPPMTAIPAGTSPPQAPGTAAAAYVVPADDWPATMSESPEPIPPSPNARRIVHAYAPPPAAAPLTAAALQTKRTPPATPRAKVLEALKGSSGGVARRGGARPAAAAAAAGPVTRVKSSVGVSRPVPGVRRVPVAATSGTGTPGARPAAARTVGAAGVRPPPTHPLSARDKAGQATLRPPSTDVPPAAGPTEPSAASHLPMLQGVQGRPFVKPLPLAALQQRRDTGSPLGPASAGGASGPAALHGDAPTAADGAAAATADTLKASAASGSVPSAAHPAHPAAGGSPRVLPLAPYTARPVPPQPVFSPRGYRRISSTGVVMQSRNDTAAKLRSAAPRVPPVYGSNLLQTPRSGRRKSAAGLDGPVATNSGRRATASGKAVLFDPEQRMRQAADPRGERAFAAVNRKPMQRLVPEKVRVTHSNTAHLQRTPRTAPAAPSPTVTPRGLVVASPKAGAAEKRSGAAGAPRRRSPLTLGSVRPVNETSRGILLRHPQRAAKKVV